MWKAVKTRARAFVPQPLLELLRRRRRAALHKRNANQDAREIFSEIYRANKWGGEEGALDSGLGSTLAHARRYAAAVREFVAEHRVERIVDLGCGDFRVGAALVGVDLGAAAPAAGSGIHYVGVDIVEEVVERNRRLYGSERVTFRAANIIEDELPGGDLCLVRQVLQHLSNAQIAAVLHNLRRYRYVLVTEHYPAPGRETAPNLDKPCGEDVRVFDGSAVYLDLPPFREPVTRVLLDVPAGHELVAPGERLRTFVLEHPEVRT